MLPTVNNFGQVLESLVSILVFIGVLMAMGYRAKKGSWVYYLSAVLVVPLTIVITHSSPYVSTVVAEGAVAALLGIICGAVTWIKTHKSGFIAVLTILCGTVLVLGVFGQVRQVTADGPGIATPVPIFGPTNTPSFSVTTGGPDASPTATRSGSSTGTKTGGGNGNGNGDGGTLSPTATPTRQQPTQPTATPKPPQPTVTPTPQPLAVSVQGASANITSTSPPSSCIVTVQIAGTISTNSGQGTIHYYWHRSDGSNTSSDSFSATTGKSSYAVSDTWYPQVSGTSSAYWDQLIVTSPNITHSNQASTNLSC